MIIDRFSVTVRRKRPDGHSDSATVWGTVEAKTYKARLYSDGRCRPQDQTFEMFVPDSHEAARWAADTASRIIGS